MALSYTSITSLIQDKLLPVMADNIFKGQHYIFDMLYRKSKTFNDWQIRCPLEYSNGSNAEWLAQYGVKNLIPIDPITASLWTPKMLTDSIVISTEEELVMNSPGAVLNVVTAKLKNVQKGLQKKAADSFWARSIATNAWTNMESMIASSGTIGGIAVADFAGWVSPVLDATSFTGDITNESDLIDPVKDSYLPKILARMVAKAKYQTGENPDVIALSQYLWDLLDQCMSRQKLGTQQNAKALSMGYTSIDFRGIPVIADDDSVVAQTSDTDGRIVALNMNYLYYFFNAGAKFKMREWVPSANQNAKSALINTYGNLAMSNRAAHCLLTGIRSPLTYAAPA